MAVRRTAVLAPIGSAHIAARLQDNRVCHFQSRQNVVLPFLPLILNPKVDRVSEWVVKLHTMPLSLHQVVHRRICFRNSDNVASPTSVETSLALAGAAQRSADAYRRGDIACESASDIPEATPAHSRDSNIAVAADLATNSTHACDQFACPSFSSRSHLLASCGSSCPVSRNP